MIRSHSLSARQAVDPGEAVFAIGDVHGLADSFFAALRMVARTRTPNGLKRRLVLLGDLIDRGKDSIGCIDLARGAASVAAVDEVTALMGNHEMLLAVALQGSHGKQQKSLINMWLDNGGKAFLEELGLERGISRRELRERIGNERIEFIINMLPYHRSGDVVFVHAGFESRMLDAPDTCFAWDITGDMLDINRHAFWIADGFLDRIGRGCHGGLLICHGHSPQDMIKRNAFARNRGFDGPGELADAALTVRDFDRLNLDAGAPSKKAVRLAQFIGTDIVVHHVVV